MWVRNIEVVGVLKCVKAFRSIEQCCRNNVMVQSSLEQCCRNNVMVQSSLEQVMKVHRGRGGLGYTSPVSLTSALDIVGG